jgi:hypothetical protein
MYLDDQLLSEAVLNRILEVEAGPLLNSPFCLLLFLHRLGSLGSTLLVFVLFGLQLETWRRVGFPKYEITYQVWIPQNLE